MKVFFLTIIAVHAIVDTSGRWSILRSVMSNYSILSIQRTSSLVQRVFSTNTAIALQFSGQGLTSATSIRLLNPGSLCASVNTTLAMDSEVYHGCPGSCSLVSLEPDRETVLSLYTVQGTSVDCDINQSNCRMVGITSITFLSPSSFLMQFNDSMVSSIGVGDRVVLDPTSLQGCNVTICGVLSGLVRANATALSIPGNRVLEFQSPNLAVLEVAESDLTYFLPLVVSAPILEWEIVNRATTKAEIARISTVSELPVCFVDGGSAGTISFKTPPLIESSLIDTLSHSFNSAVPGSLVISNLQLNGFLKLVIPFTGNVDIILSSDQLSDGVTRVVSCGSFLSSIEPRTNRPRKCSVTVYESQRKEILIEFELLSFVPISELKLTFNRVVVNSAVSVIEIHVVNPRDPHSLIQYGTARLGFQPVLDAGLNGSHWLRPSGGFVVLSSGDLRTSNGSFSAIVAGSSVSASGIRNGTLVRLIGLPNVVLGTVTCAPTSNTKIQFSYFTACQAVIAREDYFAFRYVGPIIWGSMRVLLSFSNLTLSNDGFWPLAILAALESSDTGTSLTWSEGSRLWSSPINGTVVASFTNNTSRKIYLGESSIVIVRIEIPWTLIVGSRIDVSSASNIVLNQTEFVLADWAVGYVDIVAEATAISLEGMGLWRIQLSSPDKEVVFPKVRFTGEVIAVIERLDSVSINRRSRNGMDLSIITGTRESLVERVRRFIQIQRQGSAEWRGRRTCRATSGVCDIRADGKLEIDFGNNFLEEFEKKSIQISVDDSQYLSSGYFEVIILDQYRNPMEGRDAILVGFKSLVDSPCAQVKLESTGSPVTFPGISIPIRLTLVRYLPAAEMISITNSQGDSLHPNLTLPIDCPFAIDLTVPVDTPSEFLLLTCYESSLSIIGTTRADIDPPIANVESINISPASILTTTTSNELSVSFKANFNFTTVSLCVDQLLGCLEESNIVNNSLLATLPKPLVFSLHVDDLTIRIADPFRVYSPLSNFAVIRSNTLDSIDFRFTPGFGGCPLCNISYGSPPCPFCNVSITAPSGVAFPFQCDPILSTLPFLHCLGNGGNAKLFFASTIKANQQVNLTLPIQPVPSGQLTGMWRIVLSGNEAGEFIVPLVPKSAMVVRSSINTYLLSNETNEVLILFTSANPHVEKYVLTVPTGFRLHSANSTAWNASSATVEDPSSEFIVRVLVRNPQQGMMPESSKWVMQGFTGSGLSDIVIIDQAPLTSTMDALGVTRLEDSSISVWFVTSMRIFSGDFIDINLPYDVIRTHIESPVGTLKQVNLGTRSLRLSLSGGGQILPSHSKITLRIYINVPNVTPRDNLITISHSSGGSVVAGASIEGPGFFGTIHNASVVIVDPTRQATESVSKLNISFSAPADGGSCIEVVAESPIGFDFRSARSASSSYNVSVISRNTVRVSPTIPMAANEEVSFLIVDVVLPPFAGEGRFSLSFLGGRDCSTVIAIVDNIATLSVPERIWVGNLSFSVIDDGSLLPPRFGDIRLGFSLNLSKTFPLNRFAVNIDGFTDIDFSINGSTIQGTAIPPLLPMANTSMQVHAMSTNADNSKSVVIATNGLQAVSLAGLIATPLRVNLNTASRCPPNSTTILNLIVSCECDFEATLIIPPTGFGLISIDGTKVVVSTPLQTPEDNTWTVIATDSRKKTIYGWAKVEGFEILELNATRIVYAAVPYRLVPHPVMIAIGFRLGYSTPQVRSVRVSFPRGRFAIPSSTNSAVQHLPMSNWETANGGTEMYIRLNDSLVARDYALSFQVVGPPTTSHDVIAIALVDSKGSVIDASFSGRSRPVQFGFPVAQANPHSLFARDDLSSDIQQLRNLTTQEYSAMQIAQLSSYRELFVFHVLDKIKLRSVTQIDIVFPERVIPNPASAKLDPSNRGLIVSLSLTSQVKSVELHADRVCITIDPGWVDLVDFSFGFSVAVVLPQAEPLPAFNFFIVQFKNSSNESLVEYPFMGHGMGDAAAIDPKELLENLMANITSGVITQSVMAGFIAICLIILFS